MLAGSTMVAIWSAGRSGPGYALSKPGEAQPDSNPAKTGTSSNNSFFMDGF
jgi:hypothetical protein